MMKRLFLLLALLALTITVFADDGTHEEDEAEDIPYVKLGANFSVPELPDWGIEIGDESVLFTDEELDVQIYVTTVDVQDSSEAIANTLPSLSDIEFGAPFIEGRTDRWTIQLFEAGDTSITAYAMLQSGQAYVVIFVENNVDYEAYHYPIRPQIIEDDEALTVITESSLLALQTVFPEQSFGEATNISFPNPDSSYWIQANHETDDSSITTASFLFDGVVFVTMVEGHDDIAVKLSNAFNTVFLGFAITPDNGYYLYLGLTFAAVIMLALLGSMWLRYQNVLKDMALVEQLAED